MESLERENIKKTAILTKYPQRLKKSQRPLHIYSRKAAITTLFYFHRRLPNTLLTALRWRSIFPRAGWSRHYGVTYGARIDLSPIAERWRGGKTIAVLGNGLNDDDIYRGIISIFRARYRKRNATQWISARTPAGRSLSLPERIIAGMSLAYRGGTEKKAERFSRADGLGL